ncbi:phage tail protein [Pseudomonas floridensis]|uniref:Phage tail protein n=1 Tax=Pseudomonas floridensis TaxID=1958950 RepID=A0A1X0N2K3_9PSED|nr:tail fiber assembly protein [Pseudomonas floridensis]ORC57737.1 phage tail protein [Pseudomonas floridensis]
MPIYLIDDFNALIGPVELPIVPGLGEQAPSNSVSLPTLLAEPEKGFSWALVDDEPQQLADCRGLMFRTEDGSEELWAKLGTPPETLTAKQWPGKYYIWQEGNWVVDEDARRLAFTSAALIVRDQCLQVAAKHIAPLQYAEEFGDITGPEKFRLLEWKRYSIEVNRIEQSPDYPFHIDWPPAPSDTFVK